MGDPAYRRVLVKISGEVLAGPDGFGIHQPTLERVATDLVAVAAAGVELAVVVGGGNIFRGISVSAKGVSRPTGDAMGMLATVMNALALEAAIEGQGRAARTLSALSMPAVCETYARAPALKHLAKGRVIVLAAGTGNPFFTTDTTAVLRAAELGCEAVFKGTDVDGVYSADPKKDPGAVRYERLTHKEALAHDLKVMDSTAFALARENRIPIIVFSIREAGAIAAAVRGEGRATIVEAEEAAAVPRTELKD